MTIAQNIKSEANNDINIALKLAMQQSIKEEQDYANETSTFYFADESELKIDNHNIMPA